MIVIDASMTMAWLLPDEGHDIARDCLERLASESALVPSLWRLEVGNALQNAVRRRRCTPQAADLYLKQLAGLTIIVDTETDERAWGAILKLARDENLTTSDAAYLDLAMRAHAALASFDTDLIAAGRRRGVAIFGDA